MMEKNLNAGANKHEHNFQRLVTLYEEIPTTNQELDPQVSGRPTPLDPESLSIAASRDGEIVRFAYPDYVLGIETDILNKTAQELDLPAAVQLIIQNELNERMHKSVSYGTAAYGRLMDQISDRDDLDDGLARIIEAARLSKADPNELLRLIKEYPDIISLEVMNFVDPLHSRSHQKAVLHLDDIAQSLRDFRDAEVEVLVGNQVHSRDKVVTESGAVLRVNKDKIADIRSVDSHTELIRKRTYLSFGEDSKPYPIGTVAYFRPADYKQRLERLGLLDNRPSVYSREQLVRIALDSIGDDELIRAGVNIEQYAAMVSARIDDKD